MGHIFISYSHEDKEYVEKLEKKLISEGFDVWIDHRIDYADDWLRVIEKNLDECDAFIIVMSKNSKASNMVQNEITRARDKDKTIFPVLLDGENWLVVQRKQYVDVRDGALPPSRFYTKLEQFSGRRRTGTSRKFVKPDIQQKNTSKMFFGVLIIVAVFVFALKFPVGMVGSPANPFTQVPNNKATSSTPVAVVTSTPLSPLDSVDQLLGITRVQFSSAFESQSEIQISRMVASESDIYMLDAKSGNILRAIRVGDGFVLDDSFLCMSGQYGEYQVGAIIDILLLPKANQFNASVLGIDASGNLLYCSPGKAGQAVSLFAPSTGFRKIDGFTIDDDNLYVLDASSRVIWVYTGLASNFPNYPVPFFDNAVPSDIEDAIDFAVAGSDLYVLYSDGHFSICTYSLLETVSTRCKNISEIIKPLIAYQDVDLFADAHFTQMIFSDPPDKSIFLLDAESKGVLIVSPLSMALRGQLRSEILDGNNPFLSSSIVAMTLNSNNTLFLSTDEQIYFADIP